MGMVKSDKKLNPGSAEWEAVCQRCARCCYEKLDYRGRIFYTQTPCPHLDVELRQCRIYTQRSELHPECVQLSPELVAAGFLPADCPYVSGIEDYPAPEIDAD